MRRAAAFVLGLILATAVRAQDFPALQIQMDNYLRAAALADDGLTPAVTQPRSFRLDGEKAAFNGYLTLYPARFYGIETYEATRAELAIEGLGSGMTMGLFLGALGTTAGLFDEESAWWLAGSMAAMGALFGATYGADDPNRRLRFRWRPPPELEGSDALHPADD
jgi:hypothetical protein